ncbi:hypothetical protein [Hymenobacter sp. IS2118]|nr:hypothetical protein [Hymenobacter sp. IS2118]
MLTVRPADLVGVGNAQALQGVEAGAQVVAVRVPGHFITLAARWITVK